MPKKSARRVPLFTRVKPEYRRALAKLAKRHGEDELGTYIRLFLEELAQGRILCPECKHAHPFHDDSKTKLECSRIAVDVYRKKVEKAKEEKAPTSYIAGVEATGADIEHAILTGEQP